jgi:hypothetical protein
MPKSFTDSAADMTFFVNYIRLVVNGMKLLRWLKSTTESISRILIITLAKHFESIGEVDNAIRHFVESCTHKVEVPRMLCELRDFERL